MTDTLTFDERYSGPLEPDTMLPAQFFGALRQRVQMDGERRLMIAVLEDAVHCFQKHVYATDPKGRQLFADAEAWILAADQTWFFSFVNVCEALDLDPDFVRAGLLKWRDRQLDYARRRALGMGRPPRGDEDGGDEDGEHLRKASGA